MESLEGGLYRLAWQELLICELEATPSDAMHV